MPAEGQKADNPVGVICRAIRSVDDAVALFHRDYPAHAARAELDDIIIRLHRARGLAEKAA